MHTAAYKWLSSLEYQKCNIKNITRKFKSPVELHHVHYKSSQ